MSEALKQFRAEKMIRPDFTFHIFFERNTEPMISHTHDFIEIIYISDGRATQIVNGNRFEVGRGDLLFMNYGGIHGFEPHGSVSFYNICFDPTLAAVSEQGLDNAFSLLHTAAFDQIRNGNDVGLVSFHREEREAIEGLLAGMLEEYRQNALFQRAVLESYMSIFLVKVLRLTVSPLSEGHAEGRWQKVADYIDANLGTELTLSTLSQQSFYNPSYFSRAFKKKFGMSLTEYIGHRRIDRAIRLLRETELTVEEIGRRVGYPSKTSFYRNFSKITSQTPMFYREGCSTR